MDKILLDYEFINERKIFCYSIGYEIVLLRKRNLMTGAELAQKLNISQQQISRYERGVSRISADMLLHILSIFNVSVNDFFERVSNRVVTLKYKIKYDKDNKVPFLNVGFLKEVYDVKN